MRAGLPVEVRVGLLLLLRHEEPGVLSASRCPLTSRLFRPHLPAVGHQVREDRPPLHGTREGRVVRCPVRALLVGLLQTRQMKGKSSSSELSSCFFSCFTSLCFSESSLIFTRSCRDTTVRISELRKSTYASHRPTAATMYVSFIFVVIDSWITSNYHSAPPPSPTCRFGRAFTMFWISYRVSRFGGFSAEHDSRY